MTSKGGAPLCAASDVNSRPRPSGRLWVGIQTLTTLAIVTSPIAKDLTSLPTEMQTVGVTTACAAGRTHNPATAGTSQRSAEPVKRRIELQSKAFVAKNFARRQAIVGDIVGCFIRF